MICTICFFTTNIFSSEKESDNKRRKNLKVIEAQYEEKAEKEKELCLKTRVHNTFKHTVGEEV